MNRVQKLLGYALKFLPNLKCQSRLQGVGFWDGGLRVCRFNGLGLPGSWECGVW